MLVANLERPDTSMLCTKSTQIRPINSINKIQKNSIQWHNNILSQHRRKLVPQAIPSLVLMKHRNTHIAFNFFTMTNDCKWISWIPRKIAKYGMQENSFIVQGQAWDNINSYKNSQCLQSCKPPTSHDHPKHHINNHNEHQNLHHNR